MQPCGLDVARVMAVSEMAILPDICRRLLSPEQQPPNGTGNQSNDLNAALTGTADQAGNLNAAFPGTETGYLQDVEDGQLRNNELPHSVRKGDDSSTARDRQQKQQPALSDISGHNNTLYATSDDTKLNRGGQSQHPNMIKNEPMKHQTNETVSSRHHENRSGFVQLNVCLILACMWLVLYVEHGKYSP